MCSAGEDSSTLDLPSLTARITFPDDDARKAAEALVDNHAGALGRLGALAVWLASVQGRSPAAPFQHIRLIAVGANPSVALAELVGMSVRTLDVPDSAAEAEAGFLAGMQAAAAEIDSGADLLALSGDDAIAPAATVVALLTNKEVATVVGRRPDMDDRAWMRTCVAVRDAARLGRPVTGESITLLSTVEAATVAMAAGVLVEAAARRTPVIVDDLVSAAAALVAQRISHRTTRWVTAAHRTTDPAHAAALERLRLTPLLDYGLDGEPGLGALLAVPHIQAAASLLTT